MKPIELKKRYPHSMDEDITDAFMRGYQSAQAEVVRCKDCDNFDYAFNYCNFLDAGVEGEDFFCAYGERREPHGFTADEWYRDTFGENNGK